MTRQQELVREAVATPREFKTIAIELMALPPDEGAASIVIDAYRAGSAPPWLVAHLLGCVGDPTGYDTILEILDSASGGLAASYAGVAAVRASAERADRDLPARAVEADHQRIRHGAAWGLAELDTPSAVDALLRATDARVLGYESVGFMLARMSAYDTEQLIRDLRAESPWRARTAAVSTECRLGLKVGDPLREDVQLRRREIASAVSRVLDRDDVRISDYLRRDLNDWVDQPLGSDSARSERGIPQ